MQELVLSKEEVLLEALLVAIIGPEELDVVSEVKAEEGNEAKLGVVSMHSDIVVILDTIDVIPAISEVGVIFGNEITVGQSVSLLECLIVGSVPCLAVGLVIDSLGGCSAVVMPGTKT